MTNRLLAKVTMGEGQATKAIEILKVGLDFLQRLVRSPSPLKPLLLLNLPQLLGSAIHGDRL